MITIFILFAITVVFLIALDDMKSVKFSGKGSPSPQELLDQVKGDDSWDKGWGQACIDNDAVK